MKNDTSSGSEKAPAKEDTSDPNQDKSNVSASLEAGADSVDLDDKIWADVDKGLDELLREVRTTYV